MDRDRWHRPMFQERRLKLWGGDGGIGCQRQYLLMSETVPFD